MPPTEPPLSELKSRSQLLKPSVFLGKAGLSESFYSELNNALDRNGLVKIRFEAFKEERKSLSAQILTTSGARKILFVGHTLALYRTPKPNLVADTESKPD